MKTIAVICLALCTFQLQRQVAPGQTVSFKKLKCGLYVNSTGDIGFKSSALVDDQGNRKTVYQTHVWLMEDNEEHPEQPVPLKQVADTATFQILNTFYAKDQNYLYAIFYTSSGAVFNVTKQVDTDAFKALGKSCYGATSQHIYYRTDVMKMADASTFRVIKGTENAALDKNNYYLNGEILSAEDALAMGFKKN